MMTILLKSIVFLPLLGSFIVGFFGRYLNNSYATKLTSGFTLTSFIFSLIAFYNVGLLGNVYHIKLLPWFNFGFLQCDWGFLFDTLTVVMLVVVTSISSAVHVYSTGYMHEDPSLSRFMSYLSLFTFFMLILVTADNLLQMFVGWEGVGLCSYLLINFWYTRLQANKAAIKAMIMNRIGDFALMMGICTTIVVFKTVDYQKIFLLENINKANSVFIDLLGYYQFNAITVICILFFIGAVGKSAQLGLHTWLPDAMEGPTPVSALIHAATMVTAGVFLIVRCSPLFEFSTDARYVVTFVGALTAFFGATTGLLQNDIKKVIAYSTCSQLGYMVFACGLSGYAASMFHLSNHAFFKALLFLSAGSVIHAMSDEQDLRKMGGLIEILPLTYSAFIIGSLALMGFPFLSGFYSKDFILELAYAKYNVAGRFAYWLGTLSAFFTSFYSVRLLYLAFLGKKTNAYKQVISKAHESPLTMTAPLIILSLCSIFIGYLTKDLFIGDNSLFWGKSIFVNPVNQGIFTNVHSIPLFIKLLPTFLSLFGALLAFILYEYFPKTLLYVTLFDVMSGFHAYTFFNRKWFFDKIYQTYIAQYFLHFSYNITYKLVDKGVLEMLGPYGLTATIYEAASNIRKLQTGYIYHYLLTMTVSIVIFIYFIGFSDLFGLEFFNDLRLWGVLILTLFFHAYYNKNLSKV